MSTVNAMPSRIGRARAMSEEHRLPSANHRHSAGAEATAPRATTEQMPPLSSARTTVIDHLTRLPWCRCSV